MLMSMAVKTIDLIPAECVQDMFFEARFCQLGVGVKVGFQDANLCFQAICRLCQSDYLPVRLYLKGPFKSSRG